MWGAFMKRIICAVLMVLVLCGCSQSDKDIEPALELRRRLHDSEGCSFEAEITADYGDSIYSFVMQCQVNENGNMRFAVREPKSISGITGNIRNEKGELTFDDKVLAFETIADDYITPVVSPWVMIRGISGGYITSCGEDAEYIRLSINDSYAEDALAMDLWLNDDGLPIFCEIYYKERRCMTIRVTEFTYL